MAKRFLSPHRARDGKRGPACLALLFLAACASGSRSAPQPLQIRPDRAVEGAAVEVTISGEGLTARFFSDFGGDESHADATFTARLGSTPLRQVRLAADGALRAVVPEGLAPGVYDLTVTDPWEAEGKLPGAFRVYALEELAELVVGYRVEPIGLQRVNAPFSVTVVAVDAHGDKVPWFNGRVELSDRTGTAVPAAAGFFAAGSWTGPVEIRAPHAENVLFLRDANGRTGESQPFEVSRRDPVALRFTTGSQALLAGTCSSEVSVALVDGLGFETALASPLPVAITAVPADGVELFEDAGCQVPLTAARIAADARRLSFHFRGTFAGKVQLGAEAELLAPAFQLQTVLPSAPVALKVVSPPQTVVAGTCSAAVIVESHDAQGNAAAVPDRADLTVSAEAAGLAFFKDPGCAEPLAALALEAWTQSARFYFSGTAAGQWDLVVASAEYGLASQEQTVAAAPASQVVFATAPQTRLAGACSEEVALELEDPFGNLSPLDLPAVAALSSTPAPGLELFGAPNCTAPLTELAFPAREARARLFFRGTSEGAYRLRVELAGLTPAEQVETILPPLPDRLAFPDALAPVVAGECSGAIRLEARDAADEVRPVPSKVAIALEAPAESQMGYFSDPLCSAAVSALALEPGQSQATFYLRGTRAGTHLVGASVEGWLPAEELLRIDPAPADRLGFLTPARAVDAGACSPPVTVALLDPFGNPSPAKALATLALSAAPEEGFALFSDPACSAPAVALALAAGTASADVYFRGTRAGEIALAVSAVGYGASSQTQTVRAKRPDRLVFVTPPRTIVAGACSDVLAVQSQDALGNPVASGEDTALLLSASEVPLAFYSDGSCAVPLPNPAFPAGSDAVSFYARGTRSGEATVTAQAYGVGASQPLTVEPGPPAQLAFEPIASPVVARAPFAATAHARDVYGNATPQFDRSALLALMPEGTLRCESGCLGPVETAPFVRGTWSGEVSVDQEGAARRLVATSGSVVGTSAAFDVAAPPPSSPPQASLAARPAAVVVGAPVQLDASGSRDYQSPPAELHFSFDPEGTAAAPAPWGAWQPSALASGAFALAGDYWPRAAVRDAEGQVAYAAARVVVVASPAELCLVDTSSLEDDGAVSCEGPKGPDGKLSLAEAVRLVNAGGPTAVGFAGPLTIASLAPLSLERPVRIAGDSGVVLSLPLQIRAQVLIAGVELVGLPAALEVAAGGRLELENVTVRDGAGLRVRGAATLDGVRMTRCSGDCVVDEGSSKLALRFASLGPSTAAGLRLASCAAGASPVEVQSSVFHGLGTGIAAGCDRTLVVRHVTFAGNGTGIAYAGGAGHVLKSSVFQGQTVSAAACGAASFADRSHLLLASNASDGCASGHPAEIAAGVGFVLPEAGDFRLQPSSPAVDSAPDSGLDVNGPAPGRYGGASPDRGGQER